MTPVIMYLVFSLVVFVLCCGAVKMDGDDVTVGVAILAVLIALCPGLNVVAALLSLIYIVTEGAFLSKKLF